MIHILLVILKIIGIVLLVILGLLLGILLAVLFIPVRYKAEGSYHGQLLLSVCATWFFHILAFRAVYEGEGLVCSLKAVAQSGKGSCPGFGRRSGDHTGR